MSDWRKLREHLFERCDGYCESCGWPMFEDRWAAHHRLLRSHGGKDQVENLVALHHPCHNVAPGSVHQEPQASRTRGLIVPMDVDPSIVPVRLPDGRWMHLGLSYSPCEKELDHLCWFPLN